jgi:hypothetical protein
MRSPGRQAVERHLPSSRGVFDEGDLVGRRAYQSGDTVVDRLRPHGRFSGSLIAADGGLAPEMLRHRLQHRPCHQPGARIVQVNTVSNAGRIGPDRVDV